MTGVGMYVILSLLFAFVYWWFINEERLERYVYLFWYLVIGLTALGAPIQDVVIMTAVLVNIMIIHWYIGFKFDIWTIDG